MKSSSLLLALLTTLALGTSAYASGPTRSQGAAGTQTRSTNVDAGTATATHAQIHTPGTGLTDPSMRVGPGSAATGTPRGIHTPGTGLTTTTVAP